MLASNPTPAEKISAYVERILVIENYSVTSPFVLPLYANGVPSLLFRSASSSIGKQKSNYLSLFGQTVFPDTLTVLENFTLIAYFFKPFSLLSLFGISAQELTDHPVDLNLLTPEKSRELQERLLNATGTEEMLPLLDDYVYSLIVKSKMDCRIIQYATGVLAKNSSKDSLLNLQKDLNISERSMQRMFDKNIGVSPNMFRRICQFNAAFEQLNKREFSKLSDLAFEHGYADQSHYIRAFKEFTGITPKDYLRFGSADQ